MNWRAIRRVNKGVSVDDAKYLERFLLFLHYENWAEEPIVVIAGPPRSGKTTLIRAICESLRWQGVGHVHENDLVRPSRFWGESLARFRLLSGADLSLRYITTKAYARALCDITSGAILDTGRKGRPEMFEFRGDKRVLLSVSSVDAAKALQANCPDGCVRVIEATHVFRPVPVNRPH